MQPVFSDLRSIGIVPVVVLERADDAAPLGEALLRGGLPCAEVTLRTEAAVEGIRMLNRRCPGLLIGAGTVLTPEQADSAAEAGARFFVAPGFNPRVVEHCLRRSLPILPGCATPSDIEQALERGLDAVKFFPAEPLGGLAMLRALAGPYRGVQFMPTGGINAGNVGAYLAYDRVLACGGSWMIDAALLREGRFDRIAENVEAAARIARQFRPQE